MNPYLSWLVVLVVAGGLGWYYKTKSSRARVSLTRPNTNNAEKGDHNALANKKAKRRVNKKPASDDVASSSAASVKQETRLNNTEQDVPDRSADTSMDNLQFAKEFSKVKDGDALSAAPKSKTQNKQRNSRKNASKGHSEPQVSTQISTSASSTTTGAEADDDMSPIDSPQATPVAASAGDVSDMLEAPAPAASVLRVTGSVESEPAKKKKQENFKVAETKKQRQRRMKKENTKAMVEEAEQKRRALLEKQLHTAREHERQEAQKSNQAPPTNVWQKPLKQSTNSQHQKAATNTSAPLLDTFEPDRTQQKPSSTNNKSTANSKPTNGRTENNWTSNLPSEEEQMRMLDVMNSENNWTTVSSKKEKQKKRRDQTKAAGVSSMSEGSIGSETHSPQVRPETQSTPVPAQPSIGNSAVSPWAEEGHSHPLDSTWAA